MNFGWKIGKHYNNMEQNTGNKVATRVIITKTLAGKSEERQYTIGRYVNGFFTVLSSTEIAKLKDAEYQNCIYDTKRYIAQAEGIEDIDGIFTNEPLVRDTAMCPIEVPDEKVHTITMTSFASNITLLASSGGDEEITVDWGDGNTETIPLGGIAHDYSDGKVEHNIIIKGKVTSLTCHRAQLSFLDISKNTALTYLNCYDNQLTELDVSKNTALTELNCTDNQISSLDFSHNPELYYMDCDNNLVERNQDSVLSLVGSLRDRTGMTQGYIGINGDNYPGDIKALAATCRQKNWQLKF